MSDKPFTCGVCGSPMRTADAHADPDLAAMWVALDPPHRSLRQRIRAWLRLSHVPTDETLSAPEYTPEDERRYSVLEQRASAIRADENRKARDRHRLRRGRSR